MNRDLRWMAAGSGGAGAAPRRRHRRRRSRVVRAPAAALREHRPPDRRRRPRSGGCRSAAPTPSPGWAGVQRHGRHDDGAARATSGTSASSSRPSSTASTTASSCWTRIAASIAANDAFLRAPGKDRARRCSARSCRDPAPGMCGTGVCPTQACLAAGRAPGPHLRAASRRTARPSGRRCTPRRSATPPAPSPRSWRSGATSPSAGRRRRGWPSPTGSLPWACWPRASRTS